MEVFGIGLVANSSGEASGALPGGVAGLGGEEKISEREDGGGCVRCKESRAEGSEDCRSWAWSVNEVL